MGLGNRMQEQNAYVEIVPRSRKQRETTLSTKEGVNHANKHKE